MKLNTKLLYNFLALIGFTILIFNHTSMACSCLPIHPQTHYCNADYAVVVRILRKADRTIANRVLYKIEIKKSYKTTPMGEQILKHRRLITASQQSMCNVNLDIGKLYVIAGNGPQLNLCNYIKEYQRMSRMERHGFAGYYRKACQCQIKPCYNNRCAQDNLDGCFWSPFTKCETDYSACIPNKYHTPRNFIQTCHWRKTILYRNCKSNP